MHRHLAGSHPGWHLFPEGLYVICDNLPCRDIQPSPAFHPPVLMPFPLVWGIKKDWDSCFSLMGKKCPWSMEGRGEESIHVTLETQGLCSCSSSHWLPTCRSTAKGPQRHSAPIKQLLLTANGEQNNEGRPRSAQQSDNREIMTSVAPFGLQSIKHTAQVTLPLPHNCWKQGWSR